MAVAADYQNKFLKKPPKRLAVADAIHSGAARPLTRR